MLATKDRILQTFFCPRVVKIITPTIGNVLVGLFDVTENLVVELRLERPGRFHRGLGVGVLSFEMGNNRGIRFLAQPEIVIDQTVAVNLSDLRFLLRYWRWQHRVSVLGVDLHKRNSLERENQEQQK